MKIYGVGLFLAPGSSRVVWDFTDGPFDTVNPVLIAEAKKRGYAFSPPAVEKIEVKAVEPITIPEVAETPKKKPGRPAKVVQDEPSKHI